MFSSAAIAGEAGRSAVETAQAEATPTTLPAVKVEAPRAQSGGGAVDGYLAGSSRTATKTDTPLRDTPQSITVLTQEFMQDISVQSMADAIRYVPGVTMHQGEGNRDQFVIRGNSTSADFFIDGVRDDVQYYRDLYNTDRIEALKGPNAMIFGRGGSGGAINRVIKEADGARVRELSATYGSFDNWRGSVDVGDKINDKVAYRFNGFYQDSDSFRQHVGMDRFGFNPTVTLTPTDKTRVKLGYEYFQDNRTADRGIPSFNGRPVDGKINTFFGNPDVSHARAIVNTAYATIEHDTDIGVKIRNATRYSDYDKFYQNVYPGSAVNAAGSSLSLSAYNNAVKRENITNQTDLTGQVTTGPVTHKLLAGAEFSQQTSDTVRNTGFFGGASTSLTASLANPTVYSPVTFRHQATDAFGHSTATVAAGYVQDQIEVTRYLQFIGGLRFDSFGYTYRDKNTNTTFSRTDDLISPRLGVVVKPIQPLSLYASYSVSYLPGSGDQFSSLATNTQGLKPEEMRNYEVGAKWDVTPDFAATAAVFRLDRANTRAVDPTDPTRFVQTGESRTKGVELGLSGRVTDEWQVMAGYAYQDAKIVSTTSAARAGATVGLVPKHTLSLWNKYQFTPMWGAGVGLVHQSDQFATVDNAVTLPSYTRADAAVYFTLNDSWRAQLYLENLFGAKYYLTADNNNNITPGSERAARFTVTAKF